MFKNNLFLGPNIPVGIAIAQQRADAKGKGEYCSLAQSKDRSLSKRRYRLIFF